MPHRLDPLLRPQSIAIFGASARPGSVGHETVLNFQRGGFTGDLYVINPNRDEIAGIKCNKSLADLPAPVDHVIFTLSDARIEAAFDEAIACGAKATTIMSTLLLAEDSDPPSKTAFKRKLSMQAC